MSDILNGEIPMGLGMALAENLDAMAAFTALDERGRREIVDGAHGVGSKAEMRAYVARLAHRGS